ncbi:MAG: hypothetical protein QM647_00850 [Asticcacaulis sp.]|uniref:hypothetical protein n=1 Tax=Asticcacaulis sp. TaxID=1872648 RepID=UPI0039E59286
MPYSEAELYVIRATREGRWAKFSTREVISAELIRKLMLGLPTEPSQEPVPTPCGVRVINAVISGRLNLNNGRGAGGTVMPGLVLDHCEIAGGIDLSYAQLGKLSIEHAAISEVRAVRAVIDGEFIANDIRSATPDGHCFVSLHSIHVDGDMQFRRARLRETIDADTFGTEQFALDLRNATINGTVYLRNLDCQGTVILSRARILGHVTCRNSRLVPRPGRYKTLIAKDCIIDGAITLRSYNDERFESLGEITLARSTVAAVGFDGAIVTPSRIDGNAIDMHGMRISGRLNFRNGFRTTGYTNLRDVSVGADLSGAGAAFVQGINAIGLTIAGDCDFSGVITDRALIDMQDARIGRTLKTGDIQANLDLRRAHTKTYDDGGQCWRATHIHLDGFVYERLEHLGLPGSPKPINRQRQKWLSRQGPGFHYRARLIDGILRSCDGFPRLYVPGKRYRAQPFAQLSRVLISMGEENEARKVLQAQQGVETRHRGLSQIVLRPFGWFFGFGYSSWRAFSFTCFYFCLGWFGVLVARNDGWLIYDVQPTAVYSTNTPQGKRAIIPELPKLTGPPPDAVLPCRDIDAAVYAVDLMIPLIDLHAEDKCEVVQKDGEPEVFGAPAIRRMWSRLWHGGKGRLIRPDDLRIISPEPAQVWRFAHAVYAMLGWLVVSLAILTFSGLLRQKERVS